MKRKSTSQLNSKLWSLIFFLLMGQVLSANRSAIVINEVNSDNQVEIKNTGTETMNIANWWLCNFPVYERLSNLTLECGSLNLEGGEVVVVSGWNIDPTDGELGIYLRNDFDNVGAIIDYVEWGSTGHQRSSTAVDAEVWTTGAFVPAFADGQSLNFNEGESNSASDWSAGTPSLCDDGVTCDVDGGTIMGGPFEFCVGDEVSDNVSGITLSNNTGSNSAWVITDEQGIILGLPPMPGNVDFDRTGPGVCLIWHLSYEDSLIGLEIDSNANNLMGCFDLSDSIRVVRNQPDGGTLSGDDFTFCVGDNTPDNVSGITLNDNMGSNSAWVVTDEQGTILGLPAMPGDVDFDGAGPGVCLIWHLSYEDTLIGLELDSNANNLMGCFDFSDSIRVVRNQPEGGTLEGGPFTFCVGDNIPDEVAEDITLSEERGDSTAWVITDEQGTILGLSSLLETVDFDVAGEGVCLIWHLSYYETIVGLELDSNANDLQGCFSLSNSIMVTRVTGMDCDTSTCTVDGGTLSGDDYTFCVGDSIPDNVSGITLSGNVGTNSAWVVTDEQGTILGLPAMPGDVDFDVAGPGVCLIWHLSYEDTLIGLELDSNASNLMGCFDLSDSIRVVRNQPEGGTLEGGPFTFCVGDSIPDMVSGITLSGESGDSTAWIVTDEQGTILGLPPMPGAVDFDGSRRRCLFNLASELL